MPIPSSKGNPQSEQADSLWKIMPIPSSKGNPQSEQADSLWKLLRSQKFADWYTNGDYNKWICGDVDAPNEAEVKQQLEKMLKS